MKALARGLLVTILSVGMLGFGVIGLCGGYFTLLAMDALGAPLLVLTLPCLLGGFLMVWLCEQMIRRVLNRPTQEEEAS